MPAMSLRNPDPASTDASETSHMAARLEQAVDTLARLPRSAERCRRGCEAPGRR